MFARTLIVIATLFATGCAVSPESSEDDPGSAEGAMTIRTSVPNGCFISVCRKDGSGQMHSVRYGNYICDVYKNCICENGGETAQCPYNDNDCRQPCEKTNTSGSRVESVPPRPMPTAVLANP